MGQGLLHGRMGANNHFKFELRNGHTFENLKTHFEKNGYMVTQLEPGRYAVQQLGAPSTVKPLIMEDVAARGKTLLAPEHIFGNTDAPPGGTS
ncbi:hypothetical protein ABTC77_19000, partial [Acinetobacter baumannii]